jgi:predicted DNA-binding transcriptional regulator YafY
MDLNLVTFTYRNFKGRTAVRRVRPIRLWFGSTCYYPVPQWLLKAFDLDKQAQRDFAFAGIRDWQRLADTRDVLLRVPE